MGFQVGWVAVKTESPDKILNAFGLEATGETDTSSDFKMATLSMQDGWFLLHINEFLSPLLEERNLSKISVHGEVVSCQVHEGMMASTVTCFNLGRKTCNTTHNAQISDTHIEENGDLPSVYDKLKAETISNQKEMQQIDFYFELPVSLAENLVGYRHDKALIGKEKFHEVVIKQQAKINQPKIQKEDNKSYTFGVIVEGIKSLGYFSSTALLAATFIVCITVGLGLIKLSVPQAVVPFILSPLTFVAPLIICKKVVGLPHRFAVVQATITCAICVLAYVFQALK